MMDDFAWIKKRVETISAQVQNLKTAEDLNSSKSGKISTLDMSKYLENNVFNEFQKIIKKELDLLNTRCDEFKRVFDDIFLVLKTKMTEKELKSLEGNI